MRRWVPYLAALVALIWAGQPVLAIGPHEGTIGVAVQDFQFSPATINVLAGDVVEWTWTGGAPHTVTADDGSFDSGILNNGATFSRAFSVPGEYRYFCTLHGGSGGAGMAAVVNVQAGPTATATAAGGASATPVPATNTPTRTATAIATSTVGATATPPSSMTPAVTGPTGTPVVAPVSTRGQASAAGGAGALPRAGNAAEAASLRWRWITLAVIAVAMAGAALAAGARTHER